MRVCPSGKGTWGCSRGGSYPVVRVEIGVRVRVKVRVHTPGSVLEQNNRCKSPNGITAKDGSSLSGKDGSSLSG